MLEIVDCKIAKQIR